jgi:hypothetical protein
VHQDPVEYGETWRGENVRIGFACILLAACGAEGSLNAPVEAPVGAAPAQEAPVGAAPKTYAIHLSRPAHTGDRTHVVIDATEDTGSRITQGDTVLDDKHEKRVTHFDAVATVLAVDGRGEATRSRYEVKDLVVDGRPLAHGVVDITNAAKEDDATIVVDGAPPSEEVRKALKSLLKLSLGGASDDEVFGTKTPQPIGGHWPINAPLAREDLKKDTGIDAPNISGETWLEGTTRVADVDCLDVRMKLTLDGMAVPGVPEGSVVETSHADAVMGAALPLDDRLERVTDHFTMTMAFQVRVNTPNGAANVVVKLVQVEDKRLSPL